MHFLSGESGPRGELVGIDGSTMVRGYREPNPLVTAIPKVVSSEYYPGDGWRKAKASVSDGATPYVVIGSGTSRYFGSAAVLC
ncbi:MAG: hypothetical protein P8R42_17465 [Candidatus Binatia bacterium]|nr:hypothetical protein [Candidatus Binatia bacterium]